MNTAENDQDNTDLELDDETELTAEKLAAKQALEAGEEEGDVLITLGDAPPPGAADEEEEEDEAAPAWVKEVRQTNRELNRKNREMELELKALKAPKPEQEPDAPKLGAKPTLEGHEFDEEAFTAALDKWHDDKRKVEEHQNTIKRKQEEREKENQQALESYQEAAKKLKVSDFKDAEQAVSIALSDVQKALILEGSANPATLVYALGNAPEKLKELAAITNPLKFAIAFAKLEEKVQVTKRTAKPGPESSIPKSGSTSRVGGVDKTLERLEAEAEKTGDRTKIVAYKRSLRDKK
tara:strand:+ start:34959 stop:35843 length:885 start_codon:yes stop_codon:yes gene_type:complete